MKSETAITTAGCVTCGRWLPNDQGSDLCSICYGCPNHGRDNYYQEYLEKVGARGSDKNWNDN